jgi:alkyldihydroxyacetonephosphate synthase
VITEAWMRIQQRPEHRRSTSVRFTDGARAMDAVRAVAQSGLWPSNCRLLDPGEAAMSRAGTGAEWVLVLGVESAHRPVDDTLAALVELVGDHGGVPAEPDPTPAATGADASAPVRDQAAEAWRSSFLRMPYVRDGLARMSAISETFETATTWDRVADLYEDATTEMAAAVRRVTGRDGLVTCRFTHAYPDGAAPYVTIVATGRRGSELAMWDDLKAAAMDVLTRHRATVTHHHAVGRDHRPGYDRQRPDVFAAALGAAKAALDPAGILNPGVLLPES